MEVTNRLLFFLITGLLLGSASFAHAAKIEAETFTRFGGATNYSDTGASGDQGVALTKVGDGVSFSAPVSFKTLKVTYATNPNAELSVYVGTGARKELFLSYTGKWGPSSGSNSYKTQEFLLGEPVTSGTTIKIQYDQGDVTGANIDCVETSDSYPYLLESSTTVKPHTWPKAVPPSGCPFLPSTKCTEIKFTGR